MINAAHDFESFPFDILTKIVALFTSTERWTRRMMLLPCTEERPSSIIRLQDLILAQTTLGTMVKIEGDDDDTPFSVESVINLGKYDSNSQNLIISIVSCDW
ncbi:hypothetical protein LWI28_016978 [Acer negundo]|uniref:Uncharacterized protein n=1 Tax=Acer negundo TaxID=4023 RepID=A0AAD5IIL0_ACENE|nr:hypothetical protein LWI28_016978 [Acer negundo]